jgi:dephospho-CoA kinase
VIQNFGLGILNEQGQLDRARLGKIIFSDEKKRLHLEKILHPLIQWRAAQEKSQLEINGARLGFYDASLIYEKGLDSKFDCVVVVAVDEGTQKKRLMARSSMSPQEAQQRIQAQMPLSQKIERAHFVISNNGSLDETLKNVKEVLRALEA